MVFVDNFRPRYSPEQVWDWLVGGIDHSLAGNGGGEKCLNFRSTERWVLETLFIVVLTTVLTSWAWRGIRLLKCEEKPWPHQPPKPGRQILLVVFCLMFGVQIGFKFATRQLIYMLSPCHITTCLQIYMLAARPNTHTTTLYRVHLGFLNGALLAILFPVTDTYFLPFEVEMYWVQHLLLFVAPSYLLTLGGPYTTEPIRMLHYGILSYCCFMAYHIFVLQPVGFTTGANIDFILCPSPSDPLGGSNYVLHALWTQCTVMLACAKLFAFLGNSALARLPSVDLRRNNNKGSLEEPLIIGEEYHS